MLILFNIYNFLFAFILFVWKWKTNVSLQLWCSWSFYIRCVIYWCKYYFALASLTISYPNIFLFFNFLLLRDTHSIFFCILFNFWLKIYLAKKLSIPLWWKSWNRKQTNIEKVMQEFLLLSHCVVCLLNIQQATQLDIPQQYSFNRLSQSVIHLFCAIIMFSTTI